MIPRKRLGRTGIAVPIVGMGTAFLGDHVRQAGPATFSLDEDTAIAAMHAAIEAGLTLIDTSPLYGGTRAETVIGRALKERPDLAPQCVVTSKVGRYLEGRDYSREGTIREVLASRERLGLEVLDVVCIHDAVDIPLEDVLGPNGALAGLRKLQEDGIVRYVGTATSEVGRNTELVETEEFDVAVVTFSWSLLNQKLAERILPVAERTDMGILVAAPLERGLLATGPVPGAVYPSRQFSPTVLDHVGQIQALCERYGFPLVAAALQWPTRNPQVSAALAGARTADEARANAGAASVVIPEEFWNELEPLVRHWDAPDVTR